MNTLDQTVEGRGNTAKEECTRTMTAEERCISTVPMGTGARIEMYNIILDCSGSIGDSNLESLFKKGIPALVARVSSNATARNRIALVRIVTFATDIYVQLDWTPINVALEKATQLSAPKAKGVTRLDLAIKEGMAAIDRMKSTIDAHSPQILRGGAVNLVVTDGRLTDSQGYEVPVPEDLANMIEERQTSRKTSSILLGIGNNVSPEQLSVLAPPVRTKNGVLVNRAAMYKHNILFNHAEDEDHFWICVATLIADCSSKTFTPGFNEAIVTHEGFEIVGAA